MKNDWPGEKNANTSLSCTISDTTHVRRKWNRYCTTNKSSQTFFFEIAFYAENACATWKCTALMLCYVLLDVHVNKKLLSVMTVVVSISLLRPWCDAETEEMGNCLSGQDASLSTHEKEAQREQARINKAISRDLKRTGKEYRATHRLLLLGVLEMPLWLWISHCRLKDISVCHYNRCWRVRKEHDCETDENSSSRCCWLFTRVSWWRLLYTLISHASVWEAIMIADGFWNSFWPLFVQGNQGEGDGNSK